jgi:glycerate kinase
MKILLCFDKFKGTLTAREAGLACAAAVEALEPGRHHFIHAPMSDGGEGFATLVPAEPGVAVLESAQTFGADLRGIPFAERTSAGLGEAIRAAVQSGARLLRVGVGGTSGCDWGAGLEQELRTLPRDVEFELWCDVRGPLRATLEFVPQKGASSEDLARLSNELDKLERAGLSTLEKEWGAAGGGIVRAFARSGHSVRAGLGAELFFERYVARDAATADLWITGAGRVDATSARGKVEWICARNAAHLHKPLWCLPGAWDGVTALPREKNAGCQRIETVGESLDFQGALRKCLSVSVF